MTAAATIGAGLLVYPTLGQSLLPNFKENDLITYWATKPGTSLEETKRIANRGCKAYLREIPAVEKCSSHMGQALLGDEIHGVNFDEQWVSLGTDYDYDDSVGQIREVIDSYPGLYRTVQTYLRERVKEVLSGSNESIVVRDVRPGCRGPQEEGRGDRRRGWRRSKARSTRRSSRSSRSRRSRSR